MSNIYRTWYTIATSSTGLNYELIFTVYVTMSKIFLAIIYYIVLISYSKLVLKELILLFLRTSKENSF